MTKNNNSFPVDPLNPGWIKGWGVVRKSPWDLAGTFLTKAEAEAAQAKLGPSYEVGYGSRQLGSNNFIFD